jgi:hypothetical protein
MASMANPCMRAMWFKYRWARITDFPRRIIRIFDLGSACEEIVKKDLIDLGLVITDEQKEVPGWIGHIWGFIDGIIMNVPEAPKTPHLWENKSMNDRIFKTVVKKGVKKAKFDHYIQMQMYMGELGLTRALYTAINKNDSEIYPERVYFSKTEFKEFKSRAREVIGYEDAPPNLLQVANKPPCQWCDFSPICYDGEPMLMSCRTCKRVDIEENGKWSCNLHNKFLTIKEQEAGCSSYRPLNKS